MKLIVKRINGNAFDKAFPLIFVDLNLIETGNTPRKL